MQTAYEGLCRKSSAQHCSHCEEHADGHDFSVKGMQTAYEGFCRKSNAQRSTELTKKDELRSRVSAREGRGSCCLDCSVCVCTCVSGHMFVCVCMCACMCVCACVCAGAFARAHKWGYACVHMTIPICVYVCQIQFLARAKPLPELQLNGRTFSQQEFHMLEACTLKLCKMTKADYRSTLHTTRNHTPSSHQVVLCH